MTCIDFRAACTQEVVPAHNPYADIRDIVQKFLDWTTLPDHVIWLRADLVDGESTTNDTYIHL